MSNDYAKTLFWDLYKELEMNLDYLKSFSEYVNDFREYLNEWYENKYKMIDPMYVECIGTQPPQNCQYSPYILKYKEEIKSQHDVINEAPTKIRDYYKYTLLPLMQRSETQKKYIDELERQLRVLREENFNLSNKLNKEK